MHLQAADISIGITMYRRLDFLEQAIASAVNQTVSVRVFIFDDGCQDREGLQRILDKFPGRLEYHRNDRTLTLFRNMNACIRHCPTPWLSILHDDDYLAPNFIERVLEEATEMPSDTVLVCAATHFIRPDGTPFNRNGPPSGEKRRLTAEDFARNNWFCFPGQLMRVDAARQVGGFKENSLYTGDWDLWFRLSTVGSVIQLGDDLSCYRVHDSEERCTTTAIRNGRQFACCAMQSKNNLAQLRRGGARVQFDRQKWLENWRPSYRELVYYSRFMPDWLLSYNRKLLLFLEPPDGRAPRVLHSLSRLFGNRGIRFAERGLAAARRLGLRAPRSL